MPIITKNFDQFTAELVQTYVSFVAVNFPGIVPNFVSGSPTLALFQAVALEDLFLQSQIVTVALQTRLSTSGVGPGLSGSSADVDSFVNDFGLFRLPATFDEGQETFSTNFPNTFDVVVPVGTLVETGDGTITYQVIADTTNMNFSLSANGYILPAGMTSINVTIQALVAGTTSNVQANNILTLVNTIVGITAVTNLNPINNAVNAESDAALKKRFVQYLASLSRATSTALDFAIESVPGVVRFIKLENVDTTGATHYGFFTVYVDDGTGSPSSALISAVSNAINAYRGFTIQFAVLPPIITNIAIAATVVKNPQSTLSDSALQAAIQTGLFNYINTLGFGENIYIAKLYEVIFESVEHPPGVYNPEDILNITALTVNGGSSDITVPSNSIPLTSFGTITITVT